jgi:hypothetical protein
MRRQITGLHAADRSAADQIPDGVFLVQVQRVKFHRQAQKPYYTLTLTIPFLSPAGLLHTSFPAGSIAARKRFGSSTGSCLISATTPNCSGAMKWMKLSS